jgi:betaine-aldehyde dehydrogenase
MGENQVLRDFVAGAYVEPADGRYADLVDPSAGEVFAAAPVSGAADVKSSGYGKELSMTGWRTTPGSST